MDLLREGYGSHRKSLFPTPHPHSHQPPPLPTRQSPSAALPEKWTERSWVYPEAPSMDYNSPQRTLVDALGPQVMHHHPGSGRSASLASRPPPNNWAIEMERRRVMELQQMRERERERDMHERDVRERMLAGGSGGSMGGSSHHHHHHHHPSKPNISLLPTAVMRQLHNTNPSHSVCCMQHARRLCIYSHDSTARQVLLHCCLLPLLPLLPYVTLSSYLTLLRGCLNHRPATD